MRFLFSIFLLGFSIWMLHDAWRRRASFLWYLIILFLPFGALLYFMLVKWPQQQQGEGLPPKSSRAPAPNQVALTKAALDQSATAHNRLAYAAALQASGDIKAARKEYETVLQTHPNDKDALYGAGACAFAMRDYDQAIAWLDAVVQAHPAHEGFAAWRLLAQAHWEHGDRHTSIALLDKLCRVARQIPHWIVLAKCHLALEQKQEARLALEEALADCEIAKPEIQRKHSKDIRDAQRLLRQLGR